MTDQGTERVQHGQTSSSNSSEALTVPDVGIPSSIRDNAGNSHADASSRFSTNMAQQAQKWAKIQQNTFTNWCNDNLKAVGMTVHDLSTDLEDGIILIKLVEALSGRKVGRYHRKVKNKPQKLENVAKALKAIAQDTVELVNIGNEDIVNGNLKLILGLIWRLILTYQIKVKADSGDKNKASAKQLMMTWIQSIMPGCRVRNLNKDWNTGIPLCALVEHIEPGVCPQWTRLDPRNRLSNARLGMDIAKEQLGIPQVLSPEDLISPELDDLSMLTYLSYFTSNEDSPGYQEVLKFVNRHLSPKSSVKNFSVDWKDGKVLHAFVNAIYPGAALPPPSDASPEQLINLALVGAENKLGIKPLFNAKSLAKADAVDEFPLLTYLTMFRNCKSMIDHLQECSIQGPGIVKASKNQFAEFIIHLTNDLDGKNVAVKAYSNNVQASVNLNDNRKGKVFASFLPTVAGEWTIDVLYQNNHFPGSPFIVVVKGESKSVTAAGDGLSTACLGRTAFFLVHTIGQGELGVSVSDPEGKSVDCMTSQQGDDHQVHYTPSKIGTHSIAVEWDRAAIMGSPFEVNVCNIDMITIEGDGLRQGNINSPCKFTINVPEDAGKGVLDVNIHSDVDQQTVPIKMSNESMQYQVSFIPTVVSDHIIHISYGGFSISKLPFVCRVDQPIDSNKCYFDPMPPKRILTNQNLCLTVNTCQSGQATLTASIFDLDNQKTVLPADISASNEEGNQSITFDGKALTPGRYKATIQWDRLDIQGSPFEFIVLDFGSVHATCKNSLDRPRLANEIIDIALAAHETFTSGDFTAVAILSQLSIPLTIVNDEKVKNQFRIQFCPSKCDDYTIEIRSYGIHVPNSPLAFTVIDPSKVIIDEIIGKVVNCKTIIPIRTQQSGNGELDVTILDSSDNKCNYIIEEAGPVHMASFTPKKVDSYYLTVNYSGYNIVDKKPFEVDYPTDASECKANGSGLAYSLVNQENFISIDTSHAGRGALKIDMHGVHEQPKLNLQEPKNKKFILSYLAKQPGAYLLNIKWSGNHIPGSPFKINVEQGGISKIYSYGQGLREGHLGDLAEFTVNTIDAGPGKLKVQVVGPHTEVDYHVEDQKDGSFLIKYFPQEVGKHQIFVSYNDQSIQGSPFTSRITRPPNAGKVSVEGPGLHSDILDGFTGRFVVDTRTAGPGVLRVRIYGPKGAFAVNMARNAEIERLIDVRYNPTEIGHYKIDIKWSDVHIPGSPFDIWIVSSEDELKKLQVYENTEGWVKYV